MEKIYFSLINATDVNPILSHIKNNKVKYTYDESNNFLTITIREKSKLNIIKHILKGIKANFDMEKEDLSKEDFGIIKIIEKDKKNKRPKTFDESIFITTFGEFLNERLLIEKSTLTPLGVPNEVMKPIQKDLALPNDVKWDKMTYKYEVDEYLRKGVKCLFLQIIRYSIKVIVCYPSIKGVDYFIDTYKYDNNDWGGGYEKKKREYFTYTQTLLQIRPSADIYKLNGDFSLIKQVRRQSIKKEVQFNKFNDTFKKDFIKRFDSILKRMTGAKFEEAKGKIGEKAKLIAIENKMLIQSLDNPMQGPNGLSILDEFILKFEDEYSSFFDEVVDLQDLTEHFTREKTFTMLMYYIWRGRKMK